jgi:hypothetical protein
MTYSESAQLVRVDELPDGRIILWWNESESLNFANDQAFQDYCNSLVPNIKVLLQTLLVMDYSEQRIAGKTASLSVSDPDNVWVTAS